MWTFPSRKRKPVIPLGKKIPCDLKCLECKFHDCIYGGPPYDDVTIDNEKEIDNEKFEAYERMIESGKKKTYIMAALKIGESEYNRFKWKRCNQLRKEKKKRANGS